MSQSYVMETNKGRGDNWRAVAKKCSLEDKLRRYSNERLFARLGEDLYSDALDRRDQQGMATGSVLI